MRLDRGHRSLLRGRSPVPALPVRQGYEVGFGQRPKALSLQGLQGDIQCSDRDAAGAIAQARIMGWARPGASRWDFAGKVAARLDVHLSTAFRWRHSFLKAPKALKPKVLEGTVEADETYFLYSEKGSRKLDRPARKRGGKASKRGLSDEQVPVLIAGTVTRQPQMRSCQTAQQNRFRRR